MGYGWPYNRWGGAYGGYGGYGMGYNGLYGGGRWPYVSPLASTVNTVPTTVEGVQT